jgi:hypothetical protein
VGASNVAPTPTPTSDRLMFVGVRFERQLIGDFPRREAQFTGRVRTVYGPVDDWNATLPFDDPDRLGLDGLLLTCEELTLNQVRDGSEAPPFEAKAERNVVIENLRYTARAAVVSFAQAKDLLVLKGDGRAPARLSMQERPGAPTSDAEAGEILLWRTGGRFEVRDGSRVNLINFDPASFQAPGGRR